MLRPALTTLIVFIFLNQWVSAETSWNMSAKEAYQLSSRGELMLVDIRAVEEWEQTGIAPQAITLTIHQPGGIPRFSKQLLELLDGDKEKPVAIICAGGVRSTRVQRYLEKQGFKNIINVVEGMVGGWFTEGWLEQGLPTKEYQASGNSISQSTSLNF